MFWLLFNFWTKIAVSGRLPACRFFGWVWVFFEMLKIPFQFFRNILNFVLSWKQSVWRKKSMFWGFLNFLRNPCIRTLPAWPFFGWFCVFFEILKIPFQFFGNIQNFVLSLKTIGLKKKKHVLGTFNFWQNRCIRTLPAWPFFGWFWVFFEILKIPFQFFWNIENFVLSWKQSLWRKKSMFWGLFNFRQNRCIRTLPAWPFFGWFWVFFEMLKIPFQFFRNIQNFVLSWKQSVWRKKSMFWGLLNFRQNRCIRTLPAWPFFGWFWVFFEILKIPFQFIWNIQNFVLSWKQSVWRKKSMFWGLFNFWQNRCSRTIPAWAIFWLILSIFWNFENTLPILLKHSKFCSFMKTIGLKKKKHVLGTFQFSGKIAVSGLYRHGDFLVDFEYFLKYWKYPSNSSETFKILFYHWK